MIYQESKLTDSAFQKKFGHIDYQSWIDWKNAQPLPDMGEFDPEFLEFISEGCLYRLNEINKRVTHEYFTTFTLKPGACKDKLKNMVIKFAQRKALCITEFHYTEEHVDTNYHIHALFRSSKPIYYNRISHYETHGKINHQTCASWSDALTYINKENPSHQIVGTTSM